MYIEIPNQFHFFYFQVFQKMNIGVTILMGITRPRDVHKTSLLGPSIHVPYCTSIGHPFFQSTTALLIEDFSGRPMDVQKLHKVEHQVFHM